MSLKEQQPGGGGEEEDLAESTWQNVWHSVTGKRGRQGLMPSGADVRGSELRAPLVRFLSEQCGRDSLRGRWSLAGGETPRVGDSVG